MAANYPYYGRGNRVNSKGFTLRYELCEHKHILIKVSLSSYLKVNLITQEGNMTELEAVNLILPYLGEHTVTRVEGSSHGSVGVITAALERKRKSLLQRKWWFNTFQRTISVNTDGRIQVPEDTLTVYGKGCDVGIKGEYFYDLHTGSLEFTSPIRVELIMDFKFNDLPSVASEFIAYDTAIEVTVADMGMEDQIQVLMDYRNRATKFLEREHLRNKQFRAPSFRRRTLGGNILVGRYR